MLAPWQEAVRPVSSIGLLTGVGVIAARLGVLGKTETKALASINYWLYLPVCHVASRRSGLVRNRQVNFLTAHFLPAPRP